MFFVYPDKDSLSVDVSIVYSKHGGEKITFRLDEDGIEVITQGDAIDSSMDTSIRIEPEDAMKLVALLTDQTPNEKTPITPEEYV